MIVNEQYCEFNEETEETKCYNKGYKLRKTPIECSTKELIKTLHEKIKRGELNG